MWCGRVQRQDRNFLGALSRRMTDPLESKTIAQHGMTPDLQTLPRELQLLFLFYLTIPELLRIEKCSRNMQHLMHLPALWRTIRLTPATLGPCPSLTNDILNRLLIRVRAKLHTQTIEVAIDKYEITAKGPAALHSSRRLRTVSFTSSLTGDAHMNTGCAKGTNPELQVRTMNDSRSKRDPRAIDAGWIQLLSSMLPDRQGAPGLQRVKVPHQQLCGACSDCLALRPTDPYRRYNQSWELFMKQLHRVTGHRPAHNALVCATCELSVFACPQYYDQSGCNTEWVDPLFCSDCQYTYCGCCTTIQTCHVCDRTTCSSCIEVHDWWMISCGSCKTHFCAECLPIVQIQNGGGAFSSSDGLFTTNMRVCDICDESICPECTLTQCTSKCCNMCDNCLNSLESTCMCCDAKLCPEVLDLMQAAEQQNLKPCECSLYCEDCKRRPDWTIHYSGLHSI